VGEDVMSEEVYIVMTRKKVEGGTETQVEPFCYSTLDQASNKANLLSMIKEVIAWIVVITIPQEILDKEKPKPKFQLVK
jgi:hypothetical protein